MSNGRKVLHQCCYTIMFLVKFYGRERHQQVISFQIGLLITEPRLNVLEEQCTDRVRLVFGNGLFDKQSIE